MKVGLVVPQSQFLADLKRNCPLGILYIAAVLEQAGHDVFVVDLRGVKNWKKYLPPADIYGITATTADYNGAVEIARFIKKAHGSRIMIGGPHITALPAFADDVFDDIIIGEGETAVEKIVSGETEYDKHDGNKTMRVSRDSTRVHSYQRISWLDDIPFPARHLLPRDAVISGGLIGDEPATTMITSRGCTYNCSFCSATKMWGRKIKYRSVGNVRLEIEHLVATYGIGSFRFIDDNITANAACLFSLCKEIEPLGIQWRCSSRIDSIMGRNVLQVMKNAGCAEIGFGVESVCQRALDINSKAIKIDDAIEAIHATNKMGIKTRLYLIIGLPGEEKGIANRAIKFLREANAGCAMLSTFVPYPGTDIFMNPDNYGVRIKHHDYDNYLSVVGFYENELDMPFICEYEDFSEQELVDERARIVNFIKAEGLDKAK